MFFSLLIENVGVPTLVGILLLLLLSYSTLYIEYCHFPHLIYTENKITTMNKIKLPKTFIGWTNIKKGVRELINVYSANKSFFSKKRLESGVAFLIGQFGMVYFLIQNIIEMTSSDLAIWAGIEFAISGYVLNQIQKEKKRGDTNESHEE